jgi:hypothetical protein
MLSDRVDEFRIIQFSYKQVFTLHDALTEELLSTGRLLTPLSTCRVTLAPKPALVPPFTDQACCSKCLKGVTVEMTFTFQGHGNLMSLSQLPGRGQFDWV